jgi:hypothetical protein
VYNRRTVIIVVIPSNFEIHLGVIFFCSPINMGNVVISGRVNGISQACRLLESGFAFTKVNQKTCELQTKVDWQNLLSNSLFRQILPIRLKTDFN